MVVVDTKSTLFRKAIVFLLVFYFGIHRQEIMISRDFRPDSWDGVISQFPTTLFVLLDPIGRGTPGGHFTNMD